MSRPKKRACRHRDVSDGLGLTWHDVDGSTHQARIIWCASCDELFPFGPANDTPEALVELRAAEIAVTGRKKWQHERLGFFDHDEGCHPNCSQWPDFLAGWLAAQIATHDDERSDR